MSVVILTTDLLLQSQLTGAAQRAGQPVHVAGSLDALWQRIEQQPPRLLILDLNHQAAEPEQLVASLRARVSPLRIVAFGPHVQRARLAAAEAAGCDQVLTRGQFHASMEALLRSEPS